MFKQLAKCGKARLGEFSTPHGTFLTPQFMPVGTKGTVKGIDTERLAESGAKVMLVNTYHLWLRPGPELVEQLGGIHRFSSWNGPMLSDSGGYQVFSLRDTLKMSEEGAEFRSYLDGSKYFLTPEKSVAIQEQLGVDIAMVLDQCPGMDLSRSEIESSLELTLRWAKRSKEARRKPEQTALFAITQGGRFPDLRARAAEVLTELNFDGYAVGGLSVGEPKDVMYQILSYHVDQLPENKIHYLMGVGTPQDIIQAVSQGIDLFDCVIPTRAGRFGRAYIWGPEPFINLRNACYANSTLPLDPSCSCIACRRYSMGYINHLFKASEMLGPQLLSIHNLTHYFSLISKIQEEIRAGTFDNFYQEQMKRWGSAETV